MTGMIDRFVSKLVEERRHLYFLIAFVAELVIFFTGASLPIPQSEIQDLQNEARKIASYASSGKTLYLTGLIFGNNLVVALLDMLPALGNFFFFQIIYQTGQVLQVGLTPSNVPVTFAWAILFLFPYSFVELLSYAIAVVSGNMVLVSIVKRNFREELKYLPFELLIVFILLFSAAVMEALTIFSPILGFLLWAPLIVISVYTGKFISRRAYRVSD